MLMLAVITASCTGTPEVPNLPATLETGDFVTMSRTSAMVSGKIMADGTTVTQYGIVYADDPTMVVASKYMTCEEPLEGEKEFTILLSELTAGHTYFYRTFMHSGYEYYYGEYRMFTTPSMSVPSFDNFTIPDEDVEATQITLNAHIADLGVEDDSGVSLSNPSFKYKAVAEGTDAASVTFSDTDAAWHTISAEYDRTTHHLTTTLTGLSSSTTYAICAYATTAGYGTSNVVVVTTDATACPEVSEVTIEENGTTGLDVRLIASVKNEGTSPVTERGFVYSTSSTTPVYEGSSAVKADESFVATLPQLPNATTYYIRAYARNSNGIGYGAVSEYTTPDVVITPSIFAVTVTDVTSNSAKLIGLFNSNGVDISEIGFGVNGTRIPVQVSEGTFSYTLTGLLPLSTYSFHTYCITKDGTEFTSSSLSFTTKDQPADDEVVYPTIQ